jgi:hypothetical protein
MAQIFISYSRKDTDFVRRLAGDLEKAGYDVWWDITDLRGGDDWVSRIPEAIESSPFFVVVLSPNAISSTWVRKEYTQALSLRKKVIPLMLERCAVPFALNTINFVDFTGEDYAASLNSLLSAVGYTGEPVLPAPAPFALPKYIIPAGIGVLLLLAFLAKAAFSPPPTPTPTPSSRPTTPVVMITATDTLTASPANSPTATSTPTKTEPTQTDTPTTTTSTPTPASTPAPLGPFALPFCVYSDSMNVNVREGPGTSRYVPLGFLESSGNTCPFFSARVVNEEGIWFQLAPGQQFAGKWISARGLAAVDLGLLPLPICIYDLDDPSRMAEVRVLPSQNEDLLASPLEADGTNCPFFDTRKVNDEGTWYRFHPDQKEKVKFQPYAGGWILERLLVHSINIPPVTLTPGPIPSDIPTITPTATRTPAPTQTPTEMSSPTPTEPTPGAPTATPES